MLPVGRNGEGSGKIVFSGEDDSSCESIIVGTFAFSTNPNKVFISGCEVVRVAAFVFGSKMSKMDGILSIWWVW